MVGLSGGADSMCLLANLLTHIDIANIVCCHYDHKWSPQETDDAAWVKSYCESKNIPIIMGENNTGNKTETGARFLRYAFFNEACKAVEATAIVLGHHLDDQCETVLYRLARGTAVEGLGGIPAVRPLYEGCNVVRPMLKITKDEIIEYCENMGMKWITDWSNFDTDKCRALIRHEIMPLLLKMNPQAKKAINRLAGMAADDATLMNILIDEQIGKLEYEEHEGSWSIHLSTFWNMEPTLRNKIWVRLDKGPMSSKRIATVNEAIRTQVPCDLRGGWKIEFNSKRIEMRRKVEPNRTNHV